jgi:hypothetical protein
VIRRVAPCVALTQREQGTTNTVSHRRAPVIECTGADSREWGALLRLRGAFLCVLALIVSALISAPAGAAVANRALILAGTVTGGASSIEAQEAAADGLAVDVVDASTWSGMTAAQFASYRAIIIGDPTCYGPGTSPDINAAAANAKMWGPVINGNIVILGTDPVFHQNQGGRTVTQRGVDFALAQSGRTGAYITLSCYYHETASNTPVPLLDGIGPGGFKVTGVGCYNNAHIVAESPALTGLTDSDLSNWSCSVHEAFTSWPGALVPLAIARDFDSSFTASDGTKGPPYILAGGNIQSFPLSIAPLTDTAPAGGTHSVIAQLLDGSTRKAVVGAKVGFRVVSGPNKGVTGACLPALCTTDPTGHVQWTYQSNRTPGSDTIQAFYDLNSNGSPDPGEPQTTAGMTWTGAADPCTYGAWPSPTRYYSYGGGHRYLGNVVRGAADWSSLGTKARIFSWPGIPYAVHIPIADYSGSATWWGLTTWTTNGSTITSTSIQLNQKTVDPLSDFMRTKVATHELGHAMGLRHPEECGVNTNTPSVMHQHILPYNTPQPFDKTHLSGLYP